MLLLFSLNSKAQWLSGFTQSKSLTLDGTTIAGALTGISALIHISSDNDLTIITESVRYDIVFTSNHGSAGLNSEILSFANDIYINNITSGQNIKVEKLIIVE